MKKIFAFAVVAFIASRFIGADTDADGLRQENAQLRLRAADLERRLLEASAPPIEVGRRKALVGDGYVFQIGNFSKKTLPVVVHLKSPAFGTEKDFDVILPPAKIVPGTKEIGHVEGWAGAPGDIIEIDAQGYNPIIKQLAE